MPVRTAPLCLALLAFGGSSWAQPLAGEVRPEAPRRDSARHADAGEASAEVDGGTPPERSVERSVLTGQLVARGSRSRVAGALVRCSEAPEAPETTSDGDGRFRLEVPAGPCALKVVALGYARFESSEELAAGTTTEVVLHLLPLATGFETVVRGDRAKKEVVRRSLERRELEQVAGAFGDPVRALQSLPGVAPSSLLSGEFIARGAKSDQTLFFVDGVEIPILFHLGAGPSVVHPEFLERVDFYPGNFGVRYGRAVGGAVEATTRRGATDTFHGAAKVDLLDASLFAEGPVAPRVSVAVSARRSYIDGLVSLVAPADPESGGPLVLVPRYWEYQARVDVGARSAPEERLREGESTYSLMAFGADDALKLHASGGNRARALDLEVHTLFHRLVGNWTYRQGTTRYTLSPHLGYDLAKAQSGESSLAADRYALGLRQELSFELSPHLVARTGTDLSFLEIVRNAALPQFADTDYLAFPGAQPKTSAQRIDHDLQSYDGALYLEAEVPVGAARVTPGVRASHAFINGQTRYALEPRLLVRYALLPSTQLKGALGLYTQPPKALNMDPQPLGNPELVHEKAFQTSAGVEHSAGDYSLDVTGYFHRGYELVVGPPREESGDLVSGIFQSVAGGRLTNSGLRRAYGLELLLRRAPSRGWFGWLSYTLSRSEQRTLGQEAYEVSATDQTHLFTAVGSLALPRGFMLGARFRYATGLPKRALSHRFDSYDVDANRYAGSLGSLGERRLPPFHQLDLRLEKRFLFESWTLTPYLDVQNLYNASNVEATAYDYRFREELHVAGTPLLPILGVRGGF